ncbi:sensor histidine kinase [Rhodohalobacter sp. 614A]|uniref:sensor histidine kinase n=1 Tax=Rhodohalobacter sp. 614A TaxID=2908649 RepID=UPI001F2C9CF8|nr:PAS domain S-box protein [Rhodohalobacter sp. 614A]
MNKLRTIIKSSPFIIALIYVLVGAVWIQYSDQLLFSLIEDPDTLLLVLSLEGWFYVIATGVLIFFLVYQSNVLIEDLVNDAQKNSKKFESTFEYAPVGIAHHKPNENWILVNRSLCNLLGYKKEELLSLRFSDFIHADDLERGRELDQELIAGELSSYKTEKRYKRKDGSYFIGRVTKSAVYEKDKNPIYLIAMIEDISQQIENEVKLKKNLEEKQILLSELHHRVKNNIALMCALLELQLMHGKGGTTKQILEHYKTRLKTISLIYENFADVAGEPTINFNWYLQEQIQYLNEMFAPNRKNIEYKTHIENIELNINQAIPVGLICNELLVITNQHKFIGIDKPFIQIVFKLEDDSVEFTIQNNGTPQNDFDLSDPNSLDSRIIAALTKQIEGEVTQQKSDHLQTYTLRFKKGTWKGAASHFQPE